jgi:hypothetical protein
MSYKRPLKMLQVTMSVTLLVVACGSGPALAASHPPKKVAPNPASPPKAEPPKKATTPAKTNTAPTGKPKPTANKNLMEVVTALHNAKLLLDTAIHDYDGHRAAAVGEIKHAIEELDRHLAKKVEGPTLTTTPGETQAISDAQLKQAHEILTELSGHIPAKQHPKAVEHVGKAVEQLAIALKIR